MEPTRANQPTLDVCRFKPSLHFSRPIRSKHNLSKGSALAGIRLCKFKKEYYSLVILWTLITVSMCIVESKMLQQPQIVQHISYFSSHHEFAQTWAAAAGTANPHSVTESQVVLLYSYTGIGISTTWCSTFQYVFYLGNRLDPFLVALWVISAKQIDSLWLRVELKGIVIPEDWKEVNTSETFY